MDIIISSPYFTDSSFAARSKKEARVKCAQSIVDDLKLESMRTIGEKRYEYYKSIRDRTGTAPSGPVLPRRPIAVIVNPQVGIDGFYWLKFQIILWVLKCFDSR